jgi:hypothetical protein
VRPPRTSSTILRRNSGGYGTLAFGMVVSSLPKDQESTRSDQLQPALERITRADSEGGTERHYAARRKGHSNQVKKE